MNVPLDAQTMRCLPMPRQLQTANWRARNLASVFLHYVQLVTTFLFTAQKFPAKKPSKLQLLSLKSFS